MKNAMNNPWNTGNGFGHRHSERRGHCALRTDDVCLCKKQKNGHCRARQKTGRAYQAQVVNG
ncbi:MAG: hypothetical protein K6G15_01225 [Desulfovibrio sp.]|nr:hypothetical protein [Desulfovibrio sp.]